MSRGRADEVQPGLAAEIEQELDFLEAHWPRALPAGVIHADLFPDNVFFLTDRLSGLIDFYFACNDMLAYDLGVCLNAWCFEPDASLNVTKARALLLGYNAGRPLRADEVAALPLLARGVGAALPADPPLRLADRAGGRAGRAEGPDRVLQEAPLPPQRRRRRAPTGSTRDRAAARHDLDRRRLLRQSRARAAGARC